MIRFFFLTLVFIGFWTSGCKQDKVKTVISDSLEKTSITDTIISIEITDNSNKESFQKIGWTELTIKDNVSIDIRYATTNNFTKEVIYPCEACYIRDTFAQILLQINREFIDSFGYRLKFFDCYRPSPVQQRLWDKFPNPTYVTNPLKGSMHNRGMAVDITLTDKDGVELDMGTTYDFFGEQAHYAYEKLPNPVKENRILLRTIMEKYGCKGIRTEWWHFSLKSPSYDIADWEWECTEI